MARETFTEDRVEGRAAPPVQRCGPEPGHVTGATRARLLAVVATVLVIAFLKWSQAATMPLGFALFLIALAWPLQERLERYLPRWASFLLTALALLLVIGLFIGALVWSAETVADRGPQYAAKVQALYGQVQSRARGLGLSLPSGGGGGLAGAEVAKSLVKATTSSISLILLIVAFAILGLLEVLDPYIEGRFVSLSPLVVLVSIIFWGWVWGIPGAFLGVPITIGIMIATDHFPTTRWIACMLGEGPKERRQGATAEG